jgi:hypothetical protein
MTVVVIQQAAAPVVVTVGLQGPPGVGVPDGGTTGQVLAKINDTDYNTGWVTGGGGSGVTIDPQAGNLLTTSAAGLFVNGALDLGTFN